MWLTLPPMKNYWHEPTCQQYNHKWCAEEKGHSWGPRHYVEEQLSSLAPWLRCYSALKTCLVSCTFINLFLFFFFNHTMWHIATDATCHHIKIHVFSPKERWRQRGTNFVPSSFSMKNCTSLCKWMTDHPICDCTEKAGEGLCHKCGAACLSVCARARPSCLALLELNSQILSRSSYYQQYHAGFLPLGPFGSY